MRAMDVSGEGWSMRRRDQRQVVENKAVRSVARIGEIGDKDWKVRRRDWQRGLESDLEQLS